MVKKPEKSVSACEDFFLLAVEAHICAAAMKAFKMTSVKDTPTDDLFLRIPQGSTRNSDGT